MAHSHHAPPTDTRRPFPRLGPQPPPAARLATPTAGSQQTQGPTATTVTATKPAAATPLRAPSHTHRPHFRHLQGHRFAGSPPHGHTTPPATGQFLIGSSRRLMANVMGNRTIHSTDLNATPSAGFNATPTANLNATSGADLDASHLPVLDPNATPRRTTSAGPRAGNRERRVETDPVELWGSGTAGLRGCGHPRAARARRRPNHCLSSPPTARPRKPRPAPYAQRTDTLRPTPGPGTVASSRQYTAGSLSGKLIDTPPAYATGCPWSHGAARTLPPQAPHPP